MTIVTSSTSTDTWELNLPRKAHDLIMKNLALKELSVSSSVCILWNELTNKYFYQSLCGKISTFPNKILETFGGVKAIADLPKITWDPPKSYHNNKRNYQVTAPIMLGLSSEKLFLMLVVGV